MVFTPRTPIVTGSDSGIGRATAVALAASGLDVGVIWHTDEDGAKETAEEVRSHGKRAFTARLDATDLPGAFVCLQTGKSGAPESLPRTERCWRVPQFTAWIRPDPHETGGAPPGAPPASGLNVRRINPAEPPPDLDSGAGTARFRIVQGGVGLRCSGQSRGRG